jgi:putative ABC transport system permease protein
MVLGEAVLLALLGGLPGLGIAAVVAYFVRESPSNFIPRIAVTPDIAILAIVLMLALGLVTGLIPALNAMRLKIATALGRS